ncbi:hypothetical protein OR1_01321 [Geobacter sp. OR-1]|uniref:helix-turn-helix domain-containing protein n=1 Tax=Geobacter sp. OR-1 TaxID=1266765 RepID=UPI00054397EA|nr:helix-turn-helix transcriptional regulator [Geobacter sp. OR-1]GAM09047.1 hypothetical protein OR1_01321 [Geobacter sp. OR-1]
MSKAIKLKKHVVWQLRLLMVTKGIRSASDLKRRLQDIGYELTSVHATRIVNALPQRLSTDLLNALLTVLDCDIQDLMKVVPVQAEGEAKEPVLDIPKEQATAERKQPRVKKVVSIKEDNLLDLTGPKVRALPRKEDKD